MDHAQGPLLVLAGAGSGKTRVITHRIARLLRRGVRPESVLAVSFTNKASAEMAERMKRLVGSDGNKLWLSTFHSFGVRFLGEETKALGFGGRFVVFDQGDSLAVVRDLLRQERPGERKLDAMAILTRISLWKNAMQAPHEVRTGDFEYDTVARELYPLYEETLQRMHAVDFDDLVCAPVRILGSRDDLKKKWQSRFHHLLIDEFQDTNRAQLALVRLLCGPLRNICVVGDDDQSIYGWRGAEVGNILEFERHFPGAEVIKLEENYRSTDSIVHVANVVIAQSTHGRHEKKLRSARGEGERVRVCAVPDSAAEARLVVRELRELAKRRIKFRDMAVLYRSNLQARILEEELRIGGVPYRMLGGTQFYDRKEIKDLTAYLRLVAYPRDELSLRRIINTPPRGIGAQTVQKVEARAIQRGIPFADAWKHVREIDGVPEAARRASETFFAALTRARHALREQTPLTEVIQGLLRDIQWDDHLQRLDSAERQRRQENADYFLRSVQRFESRRDATGETLAQFLARFALRQEQEEEEAQNRVTLSSLHSAKGLEFSVVFLIGCVEGVLPHRRTTDPSVTEAAPTDVEEERRLFYVGVTRARDRLYLTRAERRTLRGRVTPLTPSRFLDGLPEDAHEAYQHKGQQTMDTEEVASMADQLLAQLRRT